MKITIDNPDRLDDFVEFLRDGGCIALRLDERTIEALVPKVASPNSEKSELEKYLKSWQNAARPVALPVAAPVPALAIA